MPIRLRRDKITSGLAHTTQDDAFHEIQLNGKQLFFLFMAATVVSVVIFLCGVMVGRGVRAERNTLADAAALSDSPSADAQPSPSSTRVVAAPAAGADLTMVPPPPPGDDIAEIRPNTQAQELKPAPGTPGKDPGARNVPKAENPAASAGPPTTSQGIAPATSMPAASDGWVVQVAALNAQSEADEYAKGLNTKGYVAYVVTPQAGTSVYRVRVGGFKTRREAETVAQKLGKEMGLTPWVTR